MNGDWEIFFNSLKNRRKSDYRRELKKAQQCGEVSYNILSPELDKFEEIFKDAMKIEASGWKGDNKSALIFKLNLQKFFKDFLYEMCLHQKLRIAFLTIGETKIAMLIGVVHASKFWALKIGYNEDYSHCSPGMLLTMETIKYAFKQNLISHEFLGSYEKWQDMWPVKMRGYNTYVLYPFTINRLLHFSFDALRYLKNRINI
jgi:CelD/BcsL family acetyltransferase involved in cellulose biosynthesis